MGWKTLAAIVREIDVSGHPDVDDDTESCHTYSESHASGDGDGLTVGLDSPTTEAAAVAVVRYDPLLVVKPSNGSGVASEIPCEHDVRQAWLSRASVLSYEGGSRRHPWIQLRSSNPITAVVAVEGQRIDATAEIASPGG